MVIKQPIPGRAPTPSPHITEEKKRPTPLKSKIPQKRTNPKSQKYSEVRIDIKHVQHQSVLKKLLDDAIEESFVESRTVKVGIEHPRKPGLKAKKVYAFQPDFPYLHLEYQRPPIHLSPCCLDWRTSTTITSTARSPMPTSSSSSAASVSERSSSLSYTRTASSTMTRNSSAASSSSSMTRSFRRRSILNTSTRARSGTGRPSPSADLPPRASSS